MRLTPIADQEQLFRLIQVIPSPKDEPFKLCMASLAEAATTELFKEINPTTSRENVTLAIKGGVAKVVRE